MLLLFLATGVDKFHGLSIGREGIGTRLGDVDMQEELAWDTFAG
jgi:hypothetical protein